MLDDLVCIGVITSAHGITGSVVVKTFTAKPEDIFAFKEVYDSEGIPYKISSASLRAKGSDSVIVKIENIASRNDAESLCRKKLYIRRNALPIVDNINEYYNIDLCGMAARLINGQTIGVIKNVLNYGAGDILEIYNTTLEEMILYPFNKKFVSEVNLKERYVILEHIEEVLGSESKILNTFIKSDKIR